MGAAAEIAIYILQTILSLYLLAVLLRFLLQVVKADFYNPISQFLVRVTNPPLKPLRKRNDYTHGRGKILRLQQT